MRLALTTALISVCLAGTAAAETPLYGIAPPGPTYIRAMHASSALADQVRAVLGDRWGDAWIVPDPGRFEIGVVGGGPFEEARTLVDASGFGDVVDLIAVPYTPAQELDALNGLNALVSLLILQGKIQTGLGLDAAGLPSVVLLWANNVTEADRRLIAEAAAGVGVSVDLKHIDRPNLFVLAERDVRPVKRAKRQRHRVKHKRSSRL